MFDIAYFYATRTTFINNKSGHLFSFFFFFFVKATGSHWRWAKEKNGSGAAGLPPLLKNQPFHNMKHLLDSKFILILSLTDLCEKVGHFTSFQNLPL